MAKKDISERIAELDPDQINWSDPNAYAAMGIGKDDDEGGGSNPQGDTDGNAPAPASSATPAHAAPAVPAAPAAAPASSATPAAAPAVQPEDRPAGVATRDGKQVIPYAVLEATRRANKELQEQLSEAREQLSQAAARSSLHGESNLADRAAADPDSLTDAELEELAADFPQLAKPLRILKKAAEQAAQGASRSAAQAAATAPTPGSTSGDSDQEAFDAGLAANPLLASWMGANGKEWQRAVAVDKLLSGDPEYGAMTYTERFARVQAMVAAERGIATPAAAPTPAPAPRAPAAPPPAPQVRQAVMPSLSDLGGTAPLSDDDEVNSASTTDLLAKAEHMSDADLRRFAGIGY